jgi:hypothetical protein
MLKNQDKTKNKKYNKRNIENKNTKSIAVTELQRKVKIKPETTYSKTNKKTTKRGSTTKSKQTRNDEQ